MKEHRKPTIDDFQPGTVHSTGNVARFLDRSTPTILSYIRRGMLDGKPLGGSGRYVVSGESVRVLYGSLQLKADIQQPERVESVDENKAAAKALKDLAKMSSEPSRRR